MQVLLQRAICGTQAPSFVLYEYNIDPRYLHIISSLAYLLRLQTHSTLPGHFELSRGQRF